MYKLTNFFLYLVFVSIISIPVIVGCNHANKSPLKQGDRKLVGAWEDTLGNRYIGELLQRVITTKGIDAKGDSTEVLTELWGGPIYDTLKDKSGKVILDSATQKGKIGIVGYFPIQKDKIILDISNKDIDSLLKKRVK